MLDVVPSGSYRAERVAPDKAELALTPVDQILGCMQRQTGFVHSENPR
jgi:hypothetical protein